MVFLLRGNARENEAKFWGEEEIAQRITCVAAPCLKKHSARRLSWLLWNIHGELKKQYDNKDIRRTGFGLVGGGGFFRLWCAIWFIVQQQTEKEKGKNKIEKKEQGEKTADRSARVEQRLVGAVCEIS